MSQQALSDIDFEQIFDLSPDKICILDIDHNIIRANKAMAKGFGITGEELIGTKCFQGVHQMDEPPSFCVLSQMLKEGKKITKDSPLNVWMDISRSLLHHCTITRVLLLGQSILHGTLLSENRQKKNCKLVKLNIRLSLNLQELQL